MIFLRMIRLPVAGLVCRTVLVIVRSPDDGVVGGAWGTFSGGGPLVHFSAGAIQDAAAGTGLGPSRSGFLSTGSSYPNLSLR